MVVTAISATVLGLVGGGPGEGDAVTATTTRGATPFCLCEERSGHLKAPESCGMVAWPLSRPAAGRGSRYKAKEVQKRRAPRARGATCACDAALRLQTNHSKPAVCGRDCASVPLLHTPSFGASSGERCDRDAARARIARRR